MPATERTSAGDPGIAINLVKNTVLIDKNGMRQNPLTNNIRVTVPNNGTLEPDPTHSENWIYTPNLNFSGYDQFTYTATHGAGWGQPDETFTVNLYVAPDVAALNVSTPDAIQSITNLYGQGATVEEWVSMLEIQDGVPVTTQSDQQIANMLHNEAELSPASHAYKTMAAMAALHQRKSNRPKRMRAYFKAPETASYRFYAEHQGLKSASVSMDVWMNTQGSTRQGATRIISGANTIQGQRWTADAISDPVTLTAGQLYYLEIVSMSGLTPLKMAFF